MSSLSKQFFLLAMTLCGPFGAAFLLEGRPRVNFIMYPSAGRTSLGAGPSNDSLMSEFYAELQSRQQCQDISTEARRSLSFSLHKPQNPSPFYSPDFVVQHLMQTFVTLKEGGTRQSFEFTQLQDESPSVRKSWINGKGVNFEQFSQDLIFRYGSIIGADDFSFAGNPTFSANDLECTVDVWVSNCQNHVNRDSCDLDLTQTSKYRFDLHRQSKLPSSKGRDCWMICGVARVHVTD